MTDRDDIQSAPLPVGGEEYRREFDVPTAHLPGVEFNLNPQAEPIVPAMTEDLAYEETPPFELEEPERTPWHLPDEISLRSAVFESLGAASTAWVGGTGDRVFDSVRAQEIGEELTRWIEGIYGDWRVREAFLADKSMATDTDGPQPGTIRIDDFHLRNVALDFAVRIGDASIEHVVQRAKAYLEFLQGETEGDTK